MGIDPDLMLQRYRIDVQLERRSQIPKKLPKHVIRLFLGQHFQEQQCGHIATDYAATLIPREPGPCLQDAVL